MDTQTQSNILFAEPVLIALADKKHWGIRRLEHPEVGWKYEPYEPGMIIPVEAEKRLEQILISVPVQGVMIGHEIETVSDKPIQLPVIPWKKVGIVAGASTLVAVLTTTAVVALAVVVVAVIASVILVALPLLLLAPLVFLDPSLIVILADGSVYEVARWDEDSSLMPTES